MVITDKFVYFRVQKCASKSLGVFFKKEFKSPSKVAGVHLSVRERKRDKKVYVASIRNPWDWYVSWYHFILEDKRFHDIRYNNGKPLSFEQFMKRIYNRGKGSYPSANFHVTNRLDIGVYSYRYLKICHPVDPDKMHKKSQVNGKTMIDHFIRVEDMDTGIQELYDMIDYSGDIEVGRFNKTDRKEYTEYYTDELRDLVARKERVIINKFGYKFGK